MKTFSTLGAVSGEDGPLTTRALPSSPTRIARPWKLPQTSRHGHTAGFQDTHCPSLDPQPLHELHIFKSKNGFEPDLYSHLSSPVILERLGHGLVLGDELHELIVVHVAPPGVQNVQPLVGNLPNGGVAVLQCRASQELLKNLSTRRQGYEQTPRNVHEAWNVEETP